MTYTNQLIDHFDQVSLSYESKNSPLAQRVIELFPSEKIQWVTTHPHSQDIGELSAQQYTKSKKLLYILPFKGAFFKRCPGFKKGLACCNYYTLNLGLGCHMDCSYCFLQTYHNNPVSILYSNIDDALNELNELALTQPHMSCRVGTGETLDSLSLDHISGHSEKLMEFFYSRPNWYLELKTKTTNIGHLIHLPHKKNIIFSWSLNPQYLIEREESLTANLEDRLSAAERASQKGFPVAFYLDPLIFHNEWKRNYLDLIDQITRRFSPGQVIQLAMGSLRIQPEQRHIMRERFGMDSLVTSAELFPSETGKLRYDIHVRNEMYQTLLSYLNQKGPGWKLSLCMETSQSWKQTYNQMPTKLPELKPFFQPVRFT